MPCHHIRGYRYAYGAVEPLIGEGYFLVMPYCNTTCMNIFLKQLSEQYPDDVILLCCDGAVWHKSGGLNLPNNIVLFYLNRFGKNSESEDSITKYLIVWKKWLSDYVRLFALCPTRLFPASLGEIG